MSQLSVHPALHAPECEGGDVVEALEIIRSEVRDLIRTRGIDPRSEARPTADLVDDVIRSYDERTLSGSLPVLGDAEAIRRSVLDDLTGYGAIQKYLDDPTIEEIWLNGPHAVFVSRHGVSELTPTVLSEAEVAELIERLLRTTGRRVDLSSPFVDAALPDGSRLHIVLPDITRTHPAINIRKFIAQTRSLADLVETGSLTAAAAGFLDAAVAAGANVLVSGQTDAPPVPHTLNHRHLEDCETDPRTAQCRVTYETTSQMKFLFKRVGGSHAEQGARHQGNWVAS